MNTHTYLLNVEPVAAKHGMVMHHIMKKMGWSLQGQGHGEGSYNQSMTY